jgi:hypothetical protein
MDQKSVEFQQSSPPITVTGGGYLIYSFGLVSKMLLRQVSVGIPINISNAYDIVGPIVLRASITVQNVVYNFNIRYEASSLTNVTSGSVTFSSELLNVFLPAGEFQLSVYPDIFTVPPPDDLSAVIAYEVVQ